MYRQLLLVVPLLLLGCSRPATTQDPEGKPATATDAGSATARAEADPPALQAPAVAPLFAAVDADAEPPAALLDRYVMALLNRDRATADAAWTFPPSDDARADDAALRQLEGVRSMRLSTELPIARDGQQPPRLLEVPVQVRALTANGTFRFGGWYRVQPSADGRAWQIQSAQLRPSLD